MNSQKVKNIYDTFLKTVDKEDREKIQMNLKPVIDKMSLGLFRIVVVGEIKKGKSSFISALLGIQNMLPTDSDVATSTVYKILYGPELKYTVFFLPEHSNSATDTNEIQEGKVLGIKPDQLWEFGTETGNPGNKKRVDFIGVELPNPILKEGVVIIDTPGVGGLFKKHREITFRYAPNADAVFFVTDSVESLINQDEIKFLKELYENTKNIAFIQTKTDAVDFDHWQAWKERNLDILSSELNLDRKSIPYFPLSSKLKMVADVNDSEDHEERIEDLSDSCFVPVIRFLHNRLIPNKENVIAKQTASIISGEISRIGKFYQDRYAIRQETNQEKIIEAEALFKTCLGELESWKAGDWRNELKKFERAVADLNDETHHEIQERMSPVGSKFTHYIKGLKNSLTNAGEVRRKAEEIVSNHALDCSVEANKIIQTYIGDFNELYLSLLKGGGNSINLIFNQMAIEGQKAQIPNRLNTDINDIVRGIVGGSMVGGLPLGALKLAALLGYGALAAPVLVPLVIPGIGVGIWESIRGVRTNVAIKRDQALAKLSEALTKTVTMANMEVQRTFRKVSRNLKINADDQLLLVEKNMREEIQRRFEETQQVKNRTAVEAKQESKRLQSQLNKIISIDAELKGYLAETSEA